MWLIPRPQLALATSLHSGRWVVELTCRRLMARAQLWVRLPFHSTPRLQATSWGRSRPSVCWHCNSHLEWHTCIGGLEMSWSRCILERSHGFWVILCNNWSYLLVLLSRNCFGILSHAFHSEGGRARGLEPHWTDTTLGSWWLGGLGTKFSSSSVCADEIPS